MTLEEESLLGAKNVRGSHYESLSDRSARMLGVPVSSSARELDYTLSVQQPDGKPSAHVASVEGLPIWRAALLIVNSALGAGILNFPQAYAECGGIATALTIQMCLLVFITGAFPILAYCANKHGSLYFQDIIRDLLGPRIYIATQILVVFYMFGSTITYMIVIGDQLEKVGEAFSPHPHWYLSREFLMCAVCILLFLPLCLPKTLKVLSYSSVFGTVGAFFVCAVVIVKYSGGAHTVRKEFIEVKLPWTEAFATLPAICFGFQCHVPSVAVYSELKRPSVPRFGIVTVIAMTICNTVYTLTGSFGYLTFGAAVKSDVLLNYASNDVLVNVARVMISVIVLSTGATVTFCGRTGVEGLYLAAFRIPPSLAAKNESTRRIVQTLLWFTLALIISVYVTDIQYAISLIGGLAALYIFFFPGIFLVQEMLQYSFLTTKRKLLIVLGLWYVVVGVFIFSDSEVLVIMQDIKGKDLD